MENDIFKSQTYDNVKLKDIPSKIEDYYNKMKHFDSIFNVIIGTDSQNFDHTKMVNVIAITCEGHGGIFFYKINKEPLIRDIRTKLHTETNESLEIAMKITEIMERDYKHILNEMLFSIHIDASNNDKGKTKELIPELVGWIKACGYECEIKPDSYAASTIADKISK